MALQPKAEGDTRPPAWAWWLVVAFTLAAAFFRVFDLDRESLWNDELYSWYLANSDNVVGVLSQAMRDVHPPGYALILHGWMGLAGDGEAALRLPSVLAGTALIPLVFVCGRTLVGWRAALLAAGLGIGLNSHIATSQDARAYAMLSLVSLVYGTQVYGLTRGEGGRRRVLNVVLACIVAAGLVALHAFGALLVASLTLAGLWRVLRNRRVVWPVVLPALVGAAAFLIWIASLESDTQALGSWIERPGLRQWVTAPGFHFLRPSRWNGMFLLCPVLGWGVDRTLRSQSELSTGKANVGQDGALWCVAWVVIPLAIAWTVSWLWLPVLTERNFLIALPASWLLYAWGLRRFVRSSAVRWVVVGALTLVVVIRLFGPGGHFRTVENAQFREATVAFVEQARQHPNALSIGFNPGLGEPDIRLQQFKYYLEREREPVSLDVLGGLPSELDELLRNVRERHAAHVVVLCAHGALSPAFDEAMRKDHDVLYNQRFVKASVWTYRRRDDAPPRQDY